MPAIKFGTSGWRGIMAEDFTFPNARLVCQAIADYLKQEGLASQGVVVGYDTRFRSEAFAVAAAEVMAGNGIVSYCHRPGLPHPGGELRHPGEPPGRGHQHHRQPQSRRNITASSSRRQPAARPRKSVTKPIEALIGGLVPEAVKDYAPGPRPGSRG